jgi:hypothetical protein
VITNGAITEIISKLTFYIKKEETMRNTFFTLVLIVLASAVIAAVPQTINYQGYLTDDDGPVTTPAIRIDFFIYDAPTGGNSKWAESHQFVAVTEGLFNVVLGEGLPPEPIHDTVFSGADRWLEIVVSGEIITPRIKLTTVPYAFHSSVADISLSGLISIDGVTNPMGDVDLIENNAITIIPDDGANNIAIGETHSARTDNPHMVTAANSGALVSTDGVSNPGGDVDFIQDNAITITPNDGDNTITIGETHSAMTDNPHAVSAEQLGLGHAGAIYRWMSFNTFDNAQPNWMLGRNDAMFGGVDPQAWGDGNATAGDMGNVYWLRTLFTRKGYAGRNALIVCEMNMQYSSTNSKHTAVLFRIKNTTEEAIAWTLKFYYTAYQGWGERASVAVNGSDVWTSIGNHYSNSTAAAFLSIPGGQTSTVIVVSASGPPVSLTGGIYLRSHALAFWDDSLILPDGLEYVDDLDTAE